jgi:phosphohistidine phosphatase SixA
LGLPWIPVLGAVLGSEALAQAGVSQGTAAAAQTEKKRLLATAILLRHAEKDLGGDSRDPGLSDLGQKRALALARLLARARATHLFASEFHRTQETLRPLAEASRLKVETIPAAQVSELGRRLLELPAGAVAVVAGHANTLPALTVTLGSELPGLESTPQGPMLSEKDHARLFIVSPWSESAGRAAVLEFAYGD